MRPVISGVVVLTVLLVSHSAVSPELSQVDMWTRFYTCVLRHTQLMDEFLTCLKMLPSAEQDICYAQFSNQSVQRPPRYCNGKEMQQRLQAFLAARNVCFEIYPDSTPSHMEEFETCMVGQGW